jgi:hypothetical protein
MAQKADDDNSTLEWLVLSKILARVVECVSSDSEEAVRELLLNYLDRGHIRWKAWKMRHGSWQWTVEAAEYFFWRKHDDTTIDVDWKNCSATRTGPALELLGDGAAARVLSDDPVVLEAILISLCWNDVHDILQSLGFLAASAPSLEPPSPPPQVPQPQAPQPKELESQNSPPKQPASKVTLKGWLPDAIKHFPRPRGEKDYAGYLLKRAPQPWSKHSIQNVLSELAPPKKRKPKKS